MQQKIKVLFLAADPFEDRAQLRLDQEVRAMDQAIRMGSAGDRLTLVPSFDTRTRDLQDALLRHRPQIVHFAGHGSAAGDIYLGDEYGRPQPVGKDALARLFGLLDGSVRAVVLNGCSTLPVVEALSQVVDFAIGMNTPVSDDSAIVFARAFYGALAMGETVPGSFAHGVSQLDLENNPEATIPMLRTRPGAADEALVPRADQRDGSGSPAPAQGAGMVNTIGDAKVKGAANFENRGRVSADGGPAGKMENRIDRLESDSLSFLG